MTNNCDDHDTIILIITRGKKSTFTGEYRNGNSLFEKS